MEKWRGKNAIVTGASSGIGAAVVRDFAYVGINVAALARRMDKLRNLEEELKDATGKVIPIACDVSNKESVETAFKSIEQTFGTIQILINNAGILADVDIFDNDDDLEAIEKIEQVIQTNFTGLVHCTRKAFHLIVKSDDFGIIINNGSIAGHYIPDADLKFNVYPGTKYAIRATTEVLRLELVKKNNRKIRVAEISPGGVETEIQAAAGYVKHGESWMNSKGFPALRCVDVSQAIMFMMMTPHSVNITELVIKPTGEKF